jgi:acyl-CoA thioester hydrolase
MMTHNISVRVYYEDTDLAGIVYYANYLKFIERARTEWVRDLGVDQGALKAETGTVFAVRRVEADYLIAAKFDDVLTVRTELVKLGGASLIVQQDVLRGDELLFTAKVTIVAIGPEGKAVRLPPVIRDPLL